MAEIALYVIVAVVALFGAATAIRVGLRAFRRSSLMKRFGDAAMVDTILEGRIARGMNADMVRAAWGEPADMDEVVLKTKSKHEMKYDETGKNRFGRRVYLEDGAVVGWEIK